MTELASLLGHRDWLRRSRPFEHVVARDVFRSDFYLALAAQLRAILDRGLSEVAKPDRFSRSIPGYDAYGIGLNAAAAGPLGVFLSTQWRDTLSRLFDVGITPYVFAGAHHHPTDSPSGFIHNDLNPTWFPRSDGDHIQTPDPCRCAYRSGAGSLDDSRKIQVVRGAALIYYLLNDGWRRGDGGETGLYDSPHRAVGRPAVRVAPANNSLIAFECTPNSYHTYLTNSRLARTSIIMWIHRPLQEAIDKYGEQRLERWRQ